jgi:two-component system chemotaxis sensor kinase CheA
VTRFSLTIYHKLIALIVALMVAVVGGLAMYLSSQQIAAMTAALRTKATTYGSVMASQTTSAVAFSDRETAREVLHSLDADPDIASVTLYGAGGEQLYNRGVSASGVAGTEVVAAPRVIATGARIATVDPVVSLEGPRGVLVIELSTTSLAAARDRVHRLAGLTGLAALAIGVIAAWLIARRLALRLRAIANVATAVAGGDLDREPIDDRQRDEIGTLATAFNAMLSQLKQLIAHIQELAHKEQERLEKLVAQRTHELDQRNAELSLVFDQVDQGLFMVDLDGTLATERSAAVERLLGPVPASGRIFDYVRQFAPETAEWFELQWAAIGEGFLPPELCLVQLPARFEVNHRNLELAYKLTNVDDEIRILVVISDVTAQVQRQRAERDERETASLMSRMLRGRAGFVAFHAEAAQYITELAEGPRDDAGFRRTVHTLKGVSALEGIDSIAEQCHELEGAMEDGDEVTALAASRTICARWELITGKIAPLLAAASGGVEILPIDLERIETALRRGTPTSELLAMVASWRHERVAPRLERFADDARALAARLGKGPIEVEIEVAADLRLPSERWAPFWSAFVHAIRNAIDHGIETPEERAAAGKTGLAKLTLRAQRRGDSVATEQIAIEIEDSGRGVDWAKVADRARSRGLAHTSEAELIGALFEDGFTTRDTATSVSGRGVGLSALRHACDVTGGHANIISRDGAGTTLAFLWPSNPARHEVIQAAG